MQEPENYIIEQIHDARTACNPRLNNKLIHANVMST